MLSRSRSGAPGSRPAAAAVELAVLLPFLTFLFVLGTDFARIFYYSLVIENCARNGALWASDPLVQSKSPYTTVQDAALADASTLSPALTSSNITSASGVDSSGNAYVAVTVTYQFQTITGYAPIPSSLTMTRTVQMRTAPTLPTNFPP
jgi:Flp pilus assembly protein TadG